VGPDLRGTIEEVTRQRHDVLDRFLEEVVKVLE
jgi:hypothetical protein